MQLLVFRGCTSQQPGGRKPARGRGEGGKRVPGFDEAAEMRWCRVACIPGSVVAVRRLLQESRKPGDCGEAVTPKVAEREPGKHLAVGAELLC
jgi:hypothetical protein